MNSLIGLCILGWLSAISSAQSAPGFISVSDVNKNILVEARYATDWNFLGRVVEGYEANKCYLSKEAAEALSKVQRHVEKMGYSLLVFDCYRPQRAVTDFVTWAHDLQDQKMKDIFYPEEKKEELFSRGYIASRSGHSRGSTVDLTLVRTPKNKSAVNLELGFKEQTSDCRVQKNIESTRQIDMGTTFDCFSEISNTAHASISKAAQKNRKILKAAMEKFGFENYDKEWWHYTLKDEPFKDRYFDFIVK